MNVVLKMLHQTTLSPTLSVISSQVLEPGRMPCDLPDFPTIDGFGQPPAHASHFLPREPEQGLTIPDTCGHTYKGLSLPADPNSSSESKSLVPPPLVPRHKKALICVRCEIEKPSEEFYANSKGTRRKKCITCERELQRDRNLRGKKNRNAYDAVWRLQNMAKGMVSRAKYRAAKKQIPFDLKVEIIQAWVDIGRCQLTGIPLNFSGGRTWDSPSLDRIDSKKGYTMDNVRLILDCVNTMANVWGSELILKIADAMRLKTEQKRKSNHLQRYLENSLQENLKGLGSTLYTETWKPWVTPSGVSRLRLRVSARRTSATESTGWATPTTNDHMSDGPEVMARVEAGEMKLCDQRLRNVVHLSGWPTPTAQSPNSLRGQGQDPMKRKDQGHTVNLTDAVNYLRDCPQPARLTASGQMLIGSSAAMVAGGQLNPEHARWLMGLPKEWGSFAPTETVSTLNKRKNSSK